MTSTLERFEAKYIPEPNSGCWLWIAACNKDRYGRDSYGVFGLSTGRTCLAHRMSWQLYRGAIGDGEFLLHSCDNRQCVNPDHLRIGTYAENNAEMARKGRSFRGEARSRLAKEMWRAQRDHLMTSRPRGEGHYRAKITAEDVRIIRSASETSVVLAQKFGLDPTTIRNIRRRKIWRSVL